VIAVPISALTVEADVVTASGVVTGTLVETLPEPAPFVATTTALYVVPAVKPVTVSGEVVELVVTTTAAPPPTGVSVAVYPESVDPPLLLGAVSAMEAVVAEDAVALVIEGEDGATAGWVTNAEVVAGPGPT